MSLTMIPRQILTMIQGYLRILRLRKIDVVDGGIVEEDDRAIDGIGTTIRIDSLNEIRLKAS